MATASYYLTIVKWLAEARIRFCGLTVVDSGQEIALPPTGRNLTQPPIQAKMSDFFDSFLLFIFKSVIPRRASRR